MQKKSLEEMIPAHAAMYLMSGAEENDRQARSTHRIIAMNAIHLIKPSFVHQYMD